MFFFSPDVFTSASIPLYRYWHPISVLVSVRPECEKKFFQLIVKWRWLLHVFDYFLQLPRWTWHLMEKRIPGHISHLQHWLPGGSGAFRSCHTLFITVMNPGGLSSSQLCNRFLPETRLAPFYSSRVQILSGPNTQPSHFFFFFFAIIYPRGALPETSQVSASKISPKRFPEGSLGVRCSAVRLRLTE